LYVDNSVNCFNNFLPLICCKLFLNDSRCLFGYCVSDVGFKRTICQDLPGVIFFTILPTIEIGVEKRLLMTNCKLIEARNCKLS